jgi:CubicO group peptidase (beta-lactamase class C family)
MRTTDQYIANPRHIANLSPRPDDPLPSKTTETMLHKLPTLLLLLLVPFASLSEVSGDCGAPAKTDDGWDIAVPSDVGLDRAKLCPIGPRFAAWREADIHSVLVVRHGRLAYEHYFTNPDERFGQPVADVAYDASMKHDLRSISKSVTALVLGIAIGKGLIAGVDQPVLPIFPEYADLRTPEKDRITIRHLLTMSQGLTWDESLPYSDPRNSEIRMDEAPDPVRYTLDQPVGSEPGSVYNYSGGSATIIAALLHKATGKPLDALARTELFEPLGITDFQWRSFPNGEPRAASGLRMRPRDLIKIGQLVLDHGMWRGQQIVPADWIAAATSPQINGDQLYFYGYQFWLGRSLLDKKQIDWVAGFGYGGQRLFIVPSLDMVVLIHAGLYSSSLQGRIPLSIFNRYVLASVETP